MKNIGIIVKDISEARKAAKKLTAWLERRGKKVYIDADAAAAARLRGYERSEIPALVDMLIVLGGDGTLLSAARHVADAHTNVPIFGVNLGSLGFMAEVSLDELYDNLEKAMAGKLETDGRLVLSAAVVRGGRRLGALGPLMDVGVTVSDGPLTTLRP